MHHPGRQSIVDMVLVPVEVDRLVGRRGDMLQAVAGLEGTRQAGPSPAVDKSVGLGRPVVGTQSAS